MGMKKTEPGADDVEQARLAEELGLQYLASVPDSAFDSKLLSGLSVEWARVNGLLPVRLAGRACVLTADPEAVDQQEYLSMLVGEDLVDNLDLN